MSPAPRPRHPPEPRPVALGPAGDREYAVLSGLREGDRVVTQGALLIDGQAQIARAAQGPSPANVAQAAEPARSNDTTAPTNHSKHNQTAHPTHPPHSTLPTQSAHPAQPPSADIAALTPLVLASADAAAALAADDLAACQKQIPALQAALAAKPCTHPQSRSGPSGEWRQVKGGCRLFIKPEA